MKSPSPERGRGSGRGGGGSGRNLASCVVALISLILIIFTALIIFFTLFRPLNPSLSVAAFRIPSFSLSTSNSSLNFSFTIYFSVHNPNRAASFAHYDSTAQLILAGNRIGFVLIPVGNIDAGKTQSMSVTFAIKSVPLVTGATMMELENRLRVSGKVKVLPFFTHRADASIYCVVVVGETDGQILHYQC